MDAEDGPTKEAHVKMGLKDIAREIEHLITHAQLHCMGASLIFIGMNPLNTDKRAPHYATDVHAVEFVKRVDSMYRSVIEKRCDVHYISLMEVQEEHASVVDWSTCILATHMTKLLSFLVAKRVRRTVIAIYAQRATLGLGDISCFDARQTSAGTLSREQEIYCSEILCLLQKNGTGGGSAKTTTGSTSQVEGPFKL